MDDYNEWFDMNSKGQAAIEFIMLILIVIIYLLTITRPLVDNAKSLTEDVQLIVRADAESKRIVNSVTEVSMLGQGTKKTLLLFIPYNAVIECDETKNAIIFDLNFQMPIIGSVGSDCTAPDKSVCCEGSECRKTYLFPENEIKIECTKQTMTGTTNIIIINNKVDAGKANITLTG